VGGFEFKYVRSVKMVGYTYTCTVPLYVLLFLCVCELQRGHSISILLDNNMLAQAQKSTKPSNMASQTHSSSGISIT
jgi:hypothetical protein